MAAALKSSPYWAQAQLLLRVLSSLSDNTVFALKGGTALNFFIRPLPRLSVDIDLAYLPISNRAEALPKIGRELKKIKQKLQLDLPGAVVNTSPKELESSDTRDPSLTIRKGQASVQLKPNRVIRGSVFPSLRLDLIREAEEIFEMAFSMTVLSRPDLYAGKICAALDRQHPRDLFDVKLLLDNEGIDEQTRQAFVVYLSSHNRPAHELLKPRFKDLRHPFINEFQGMTRGAVSLTDLCATRQALVKALNRDLNLFERQFLISIQEANPDWSLLPIPHLEQLPALQWKLQNIRKMDSQKQKQHCQVLRDILDIPT